MSSTLFPNLDDDFDIDSVMSLYKKKAEPAPPPKQETLEESIAKINAGLTEGQRKGAETIKGPVLLIAGAGAGKTKTLTHRVSTMLLNGIHPTEIALMTFTNKSAEDIQDRVAEMVGDNAQYITIGTFHSIIFKKMIQANPESKYLASLGIDPTTIRIADDDDFSSLLKTSISELSDQDKEQISDNEWTVKTFKSVMSKARASGFDHKDFLSTSLNGDRKHEELNRVTYRIWKRYIELARDAGVIDFDDILVVANKMLRSEPNICESLSRVFRYVMLDEYQDTNRVQMSIMDLICRYEQNICCVGDEKQSIYGFREADIKVILTFKERYPDAQIIEMKDNFRSYPAIINCGNALADAMTQRLSDGQLTIRRPYDEDEALRLSRKQDSVNMVQFNNEIEEAEVVARAIQRDLKMGVKGQDIAVLYRNRAIKRHLDRRLAEMNIPYRLVGDKGFFERREVKDTLAMVRFIVNPFDSLSGYRFLSRAKIGISESAAKQAGSGKGGNKGIPLITFLRQKSEDRLKVKTGKAPLKKYAAKIEPFLRLSGLIRDSFKYQDPPSQIKTLLAETFDIYMSSSIENGKPSPEERQYRMDNVTMMLDRIESDLNKGLAIQAILDDLSLLVENDSRPDDSPENKVLLMTLHASKGLEFDHVYMIGLEQSVVVGDALSVTIDDIEEARRLIYVGITRAKKKLAMSCATERFSFGELVHSHPCDFMTEICDRTNLSIYEMPISYNKQSNKEEDNPSPR